MRTEKIEQLLKIAEVAYRVGLTRMSGEAMDRTFSLVEEDAKPLSLKDLCKKYAVPAMRFNDAKKASAAKLWSDI